MFKYVCAALMAVLSVSVAHAKPTAIYGEDDRTDPYLEKDPRWVESARSTAIFIKKSGLRTFEANGIDVLEAGYEISGKTHQQDLNLCDGERFGEQYVPVTAQCSVSLIAPNVVMTAGHCAESEADCAEAAFVFDYGYYSADTPLNSILKTKASNVYGCKKIIYQKRESQDHNGVSRRLDIALLELDRPVTDRKPVELDRSSYRAVGDNLMMIGHPAGLPVKTASGTVNRYDREEAYFTSNLDAFGGNSGSSVFDESTGRIVGVLVRGRSDYYPDETKGCIKTTRFAQSEGGEAVSDIHQIPAEILDQIFAVPSAEEI